MAVEVEGTTTRQTGKRDGSAPPTTTTTTKRKQREVGPRDVARCEQIAALLSKGLKGKALEAAIADFDASRAPVVITPRFEAPMTALQYEGGGGGGGAKAVVMKQEDGERRASVSAQVPPLVLCAPPRGRAQQGRAVHAPCLARLSLHHDAFLHHDASPSPIDLCICVSPTPTAAQTRLHTDDDLLPLPAQTLDVLLTHLPSPYPSPTGVASLYQPLPTAAPPSSRSARRSLPPRCTPTSPRSPFPRPSLRARTRRSCTAQVSLTAGTCTLTTTARIPYSGIRPLPPVPGSLQVLSSVFRKRIGYVPSDLS